MKSKPTQPEEASGSDTQTTNALLMALLALAFEQRGSPDTQTPRRRRPELLLSDLGLGNARIAQVLGSTPDAVRMVVSRARARATVRPSNDTPEANPRASGEG